MSELTGLIISRIKNTNIVICDDEPTPNQRQLAVLGLPMSCLTAAPVCDVPYIDNSFRGDSRGKGGKTKYIRK